MLYRISSIILFISLIVSLNTSAQNGITIKDSVNFKMDGFNSGYELTLCSDQTFRCTFTIAGCLVMMDECGNRVGAPVITETIDGEYSIDDYTLTFNPNAENFFFEAPYFILAIKNKTYLIWSREEELQRIKEWREDFDQPFPEYLINMNDSGIFSFFLSDQKIELSGELEKMVYDRFK